MKRFNQIWVFLLILCLVGCSGGAEAPLPSVDLPSELLPSEGEIIFDSSVSTEHSVPTEESAVNTDPTGTSSASDSEPSTTEGATEEPPTTELQDSTAPSHSDEAPPEVSTQMPTYETVPPSEDGSVELREGKLSFSSCGRYSGAFVEDGSDRPVENVAAILVTNLTGDYLTYAALQFEINGEAATFVVTGLPAGESAWVLEYNALQIDSGASFVALDSAMQFIPTESWDELEVTFREGLLSAKNLTDQTYIDGYVYYKRLHTDGNYLGGITYRSSLGDLAPGDTIEVTAGHAGEELCRVVRITQNTEE